MNICLNVDTTLNVPLTFVMFQRMFLDRSPSGCNAETFRERYQNVQVWLYCINVPLTIAIQKKP